MVSGKLEITIKITELPQATTGENGWQQFEIDCDGRIITVTVKPKIWKKLTDAQANYPQWVAAIAGKMGERMIPKNLSNSTHTGRICVKIGL